MTQHQYHAIEVGGDPVDRRTARGDSHYAAALSATALSAIGETLVTQGPRGATQRWTAIGPSVNGHATQVVKQRTTRHETSADSGAASTVLDPEETYLFLDIEADGPVPGMHSMLAMGIAAFNWKGDVIDHFYAKLQRLPEATIDPVTEIWWRQQPMAAYIEARSNAYPPARVMRKFQKWWNGWSSWYPNPVLVANPIHFDGAWLRYYAYRYLRSDVFGGREVRCIDMYSLAIGKYGGGNRHVNYDVNDYGEKPHHALKDVYIQAASFFDMVQDKDDNPPPHRPPHNPAAMAIRWSTCAQAMMVMRILLIQ